MSTPHPLSTVGRTLEIGLPGIERENHLSLVVFNNFMNTKYNQSAHTDGPIVPLPRGERTQPTYHTSTTAPLPSNPWLGFDRKVGVPGRRR